MIADRAADCFIACCAMLLVALVARPLAAQEPDSPQPTAPEVSEQQYMLLQNQFGELCTMCEATVVCTAGSATPDLDDLRAGIDEPYTIYHFHTKTFLDQMATIWHYMIRWIEPVLRGKRPVTVYSVTAGNAALAERSRTELMAYLSIEPALIEIGDRRIDRWTNQWQTQDAEGTGSCGVLPLRDTWAFLQDYSPWREIQATASLQQGVR